MIVASDLDRTLMYSKRSLEELGCSDKAELKPVEMKDGQWVAFMTKAAFTTLKQLNRHCLFVPVTTRTTEQFKRFVIFEEDIPLTYTITSNGATILYKGKPMYEWSEHLKNCLKNESALQDEVLYTLKKEGLKFDGKLKKVEKLFFYYLLNNLPSASELQEIRELATENGWRISLQGRKLYFIPTAISKGHALEFICSREGKKVIAGAGDSVLDWDFLINCQYRFVPSHGELINHIETADVTLTNKLGIGAGEEIMQHFLRAISLKI